MADGHISAAQIGKLEACQKSLVQAGLDLVHWFSVSACNQRLEPSIQLPQLGDDDSLGLFVGNSKRLWPAFTSWLRGAERQQDIEPGLAAHPLDHYVESAIATALASIAAPSWVRFGHSGQPLPLQRYAQAAGLAHLGPAHLCIHPKHGPWLALRAVVVLRLSPPQDSASILVASDSAQPLCTSCEAPCMNPDEQERALETLAQPNSSRYLPRLSQEHLQWLSVRDSCPVGRASRYSEEQIIYHYEKQLPRT